MCSEWRPARVLAVLPLLFASAPNPHAGSTVAAVGTVCCCVGPEWALIYCWETPERELSFQAFK